MDQSKGLKKGTSHSQKLPSKHGPEKLELMSKYPPLWAEKQKHHSSRKGLRRGLMLITSNMRITSLKSQVQVHIYDVVVL